MLMPLFLRFPRLWFDSQLKSCLFPDKLLGSIDFFSPLFPSHKTSPLDHRDFIITAPTTGHPPCLSCRGDRGTQTSQLLLFTQLHTTTLLVPCCLHQPCQRQTDGGPYPHPFLLVTAAPGGAHYHHSMIPKSKPGQRRRCESCTFPASFFYL